MNKENKKLSLVERALWEGIEQKADNHVVNSDTWVQMTSPHAPVAFLNGVYKCQLTEDTIHSQIQKTLEHYKKINIPFRWKVSPSTSPKNLKYLLPEYGIPHKETLYGLYAEPGALDIPINPEITILELDLENLEDWLKVQASAWNVPPPGITHLREKGTKAMKAGDFTYRNYIAYAEGLPVASAGLRFYNDYAFLVGAAVNPERRHKGIYRTLLAHRLKVIAERNLPAVIHCLEKTSAPICMKLGFEKICEIYSFETAPTT